MDSGTEHKATSPRVTLWQLAKVFAQMGASGFGSSMLPYYRSRLVKDLKWVSEDEFLRALKIGQSLPGLNATNMSVIFGDRLAGPIGSLVATIAVLLPGAVSLCLMGAFYLAHQSNSGLDRALDGVAAAACAVLLATTWHLGKSQILSPRVVMVAITAVTVGYFRVSLPIALLVLVPISVWLCRPKAVS